LRTLAGERPAAERSATKDRTSTAVKRGDDPVHQPVLLGERHVVNDPDAGDVLHLTET